MKATSVLLTIGIAVVLQMTLARYAVGGRWQFDLVLVGVVYAALFWGPAAGMFAGTVGGVIQDALANEVVGVGGLAKTIVGAAVGVVGIRFVVARPAARMLAVAGATVVHRAMIVGLHALIEQRWSGLPGTAILVETGLNALCGFVAFQASESVPGAFDRGRSRRRSGLRRREW